MERIGLSTLLAVLIYLIICAPFLSLLILGKGIEYDNWMCTSAAVISGLLGVYLVNKYHK